MTVGTVSNCLLGALRDPFIRPFPEHPPVKTSDRCSNIRSWPDRMSTHVCLHGPFGISCVYSHTIPLLVMSPNAPFTKCCAQKISTPPKPYLHAHRKTHMHDTAPAQPANALVAATCFTKTFRVKLSGQDEATTLHRMTTCGAFAMHWGGRQHLHCLALHARKLPVACMRLRS